MVTPKDRMDGIHKLDSFTLIDQYKGIDRFSISRHRPPYLCVWWWLPPQITQVYFGTFDYCHSPAACTASTADQSVKSPGKSFHLSPEINSGIQWELSWRRLHSEERVQNETLKWSDFLWMLQHLSIGHGDAFSPSLSLSLTHTHTLGLSFSASAILRLVLPVRHLSLLSFFRAHNRWTD